MNITFVAPGILPVPPIGYGGIELGMWNRRRILLNEGHSVSIVNVRSGGNSFIRRLKIVREVNASNPDVVHIHTAKYFGISRFIRCRNVVFSDHNAHVSFEGYKYHRNAKIKGMHTICLSNKIKKLYASAGVDPEFLHLIPNEVTVDQIVCSDKPEYADKSICLGIIYSRKRQHKLAGIAGIDFVGPIHEKTDFLDGAYKGEWSREQVCENLTAYANKVLISKAEAHNRACLEALAAGLGLVISEAVADNLDTSLPFIDVIPEDKIDDTEYIKKTIIRNRETSIPMRKEIREYAKNFDTENVVKTHYLPLLLSIVKS